MGKKILTWDEYQNLITKINEAIDFSNIDLIIGLTRGGLVPAIQLSNKNDIKMLTLALSLRDNTNDSMYEKELSEIQKHDNILIIDDIYDYGKTVAKIKQDLPGKNLKFYTIYSTDENAVDYFSLKKEIDDWIVFPWEI